MSSSQNIINLFFLFMDLIPLFLCKEVEGFDLIILIFLKLTNFINLYVF